jgi:hypothetical protein
MLADELRKYQTESEWNRCTEPDLILGFLKAHGFSEE